MTVSELIAVLSTMPPDAPVFYHDHEYNDTESVDVVRRKLLYVLRCQDGVVRWSADSHNRADYLLTRSTGVVLNSDASYDPFEGLEGE